MSIFLRIWLAFAVVLLVGAYATISTLQDQVKPSIKQAIEDTLADNANIISALVVDDLKEGRLQTPEFQQKIQDVLQRQLRARIWQYQKATVSQQLYITDNKGIVLYDSQGLVTGQNFAQWNDVYLTLQGRYGVRTTRSDINDANTSVMYVAAPIMDHQQIIGVVSLSKAGRMMQPFIERAQQQMLQQGIIVAILALIFSGLVAWWLRHAIYAVSQYALTLSSQQRQPLRFWAASELNLLVDAIDKMRQELEGKHYIEHYVQTLTHELKSPLTAIKASAEILQDELSAQDRQRFTTNISEQTDKLQQLIERLLLLTRLEKQSILTTTAIHVLDLVNKVVAEKIAIIEKKQIQLIINIHHDYMIEGEYFWLAQALSNILDNAIDFTPVQHAISICSSTDKHFLCLSISNEGENIPDYALSQVFDRYYSLPRPDTQRKSTGLGLTLVKEVMALHQGRITIANDAQGVCVTLYFPRITS
jgi:two-component system sensor histidine kinase CreC